MRVFRVACAFVLLVGGIAGCFSLSLGGSGHRNPTMAQEITELSKLRSRGTINDEEFRIGKATILRHYGESPASVDYPDTQLASYPAPAEETQSQ